MFDYYKYTGEKNMKVFISWSGEVSFKIAKVLKDWIPCVIHCVEPYFSSEDIDKGARWSTDIANELETASFGVLCVTKDNLESKWLNFEAGALSKAIDKSRVCPLLFHLKPSDISDSPILQFQMANVEKEDIFKLFKSINSTLDENGLDESRLEKMFFAFWPEMKKEFDKIEDINVIDDKSINEKNDSSQILEEMLELLRYQQMLLKTPDKILPMEYIHDIISQIQRETSRIAYSRIPKSALGELEHNEMILRNLLYGEREIDQELIERIKVAVREYVLSCDRILKFIGVRYPRYSIYREKE